MSPTLSPVAPVSVVTSVVACSMTVNVRPCPRRSDGAAHALTATMSSTIAPSGTTVVMTRFMAHLLLVGRLPSRAARAASSEGASR